MDADEHRQVQPDCRRARLVLRLLGHARLQLLTKRCLPCLLLHLRLQLQYIWLLFYSLRTPNDTLVARADLQRTDVLMVK
jgi:hypothetical protein